MTPESKGPHVLIVGAGLGGLALAQCLRKRGISFEIFERDADENSRPQGWAIGLHTMLDELHNSIPSDLPNLHDNVHHLLPLKLNSQICVYFQGIDGRIGVQDTPETPCLRADRPKFRLWLSTNIPIQWNKRLTQIDESVDGNVSLKFQDGSTANGEILIGADGVQSFVRENLIQRPNNEFLRVVPTATIIGELKLSGAAFERQLSLGHSSWIAVASDWKHRLFTGLQHVSSDGKSGDYYWFYTEHDDSVDRPDHWMRLASLGEKLAYVRRRISSFDPELREVVEATSADNIKDTHFLWRDAELPSLPLGRVALLGDAAHPMTPFRGEGGVHAIRDALLLAKHLSHVNIHDSQGLFQTIGEYHAEVLERGVQAVRASRGAFHGHGQGKPSIVGWGHTAVPIPEENVSLSAVC
ncbi:hypothetical protein TruAng_007011 [Truncatella angustata]|nr:hypothetical protein TruAng_007011 [Truncatella angustata]